MCSSRPRTVSAVAATCLSLSLLLVLPVVTSLAAVPPSDAVLLAYDVTPGTRLRYEFRWENTIDIVSPRARTTFEKQVHARVEYEVLPLEVKAGRHGVRCSVSIVSAVATVAHVADAFAEAAGLPCEGSLGPTGLVAKLTAPKEAPSEVKAAVIDLNKFIGVGAIGPARLPGLEPVPPGHRWGPGLEGRGSGARYVYTFSGVEMFDGHRVARIDFSNDVDRPASHERAEGYYTFDLDDRRWLTTVGSSDTFFEGSGGPSRRIVSKTEASLAP